MLTGRYDNSIDDKSRVIIPVKFRAFLGSTCVVAFGREKCLYLYNTEGWENFMSRLDDLSEDDEKIRALILYHDSTSTECDIDRQGRLTLPQAARDFAGLERDVATLWSRRNRVEVWDRELLNRTIRDTNVRELSNYAAELQRR